MKWTLLRRSNVEYVHVDIGRNLFVKHDRDVANVFLDVIVHCIDDY